MRCFCSIQSQLCSLAKVVFLKQGGMAILDPSLRPLSVLMPQRTRLQVHGLAEVSPSIDGAGSKLLLDAQDLVEFGQTFRTCWSTAFDLASSNTDNNVCDGDIFSLARSVGNHHAPSGSVGVLGSLDGFGESTNLVDLQEKSIARLELDGLLDADRICHSQVITVLCQYNPLLVVAMLTQRSESPRSCRNSSTPPSHPPQTDPRY